MVDQGTRVFFEAPTTKNKKLLPVDQRFFIIGSPGSAGRGLGRHASRVRVGWCFLFCSGLAERLWSPTGRKKTKKNSGRPGWTANIFEGPVTCRRSKKEHNNMKTLAKYYGTLSKKRELPISELDIQYVFK